MPHWANGQLLVMLIHAIWYFLLFLFEKSFQYQNQNKFYVLSVDLTWEQVCESVIISLLSHIVRPIVSLEVGLEV